MAKPNQNPPIASSVAPSIAPSIAPKEDKWKLGMVALMFGICLWGGFGAKPPARPDDVLIDRTANLICLPTCPTPTIAHSTNIGSSDPVIATAASLAPELSPEEAKQLFHGGANSLVARAVGSAEGTRRPDGSKNRAYYGHVDPGNKVWNLGSFSYQHGASSPEEADRKQLRRLKFQYQVIADQATRRNIELTPAEQLNAIDLANQAPLAALPEHGGFVDRLLEARQKGLPPGEAILSARVNTYRNPRTDLWEAPGLGNTEGSIRRDQARRQEAIASAMVAK
jgi:hypothetical protein